MKRIFGMSFPFQILKKNLRIVDCFYLDIALNRAYVTNSITLDDFKNLQCLLNINMCFGWTRFAVLGIQVVSRVFTKALLKQSKNKFGNSRVFNPQLWGFFELSCSPKTSIYGIVAIYEHKFGSKPPKMSPKTRTYFRTLTFEVIPKQKVYHIAIFNTCETI